MRRAAIALVLCAACTTGRTSDNDVQQAATVCGGSAVVNGMDVASYDDVTDWAAAKASGIQFAFIRVSDGLQYPDPTFADKWPAAKAAGMLRGAYQYFRPAEDPIAQADLLLNATGPLMPGDLPPVLDLEVNGGLTQAQVTAAVKQWIDHVTAAIGRPPIVYAGLYSWPDLTGGADFTTSPLWIAQYTSAACPNIPGPWTKWLFWQDTASGSAAGVTGSALDLDVFDGTYTDLVAFANGSAAPCGVIDPTGGEIDDGDACFGAGGPSATLRHVTDAGMDSDLIWTHATAATTEANFATWSLYFAEAGTYQVEAYTANAYATSKQATYEVNHAGGMAAATIDQSAVDGWQLLGTFDFAAGGDQSIHLGDNTGEASTDQAQLVFDAIRLTRVDTGSGSDGDPPKHTGGGCDGGGGGAGWLLALLALIAACGPTSKHGDGGGNGGDGSNGCATQCSSDLHSVTDCNNNVLMTCTGDLGCANGACVPACDSAAANKSSIGCDYYSVDPDVIPEDKGGCFAAYIANTWGSPVSIAVDLGGQALPVDQFARVPTGQGQGITYAPLTNGMLQPNQVAILFLARNGIASANCPAGITPAVTATDAAVHGTGRGQAFHIVTSAPTVAYDIYPYGGGNSAVTSATLLLPTSAWDLNYVGADAFRKSTTVADAQPFVELVGQQDATTVTIRPTAAIAGSTNVSAAAAGANATYTLGKGEVLQFTQDAELAGSPITADKPVGVWGGESCLSIDVDQAACDSAHQQIPPVKAMGNHYAAVRYRNRFAGQEETVPWRMVGAVDGTTLTYAPSMPAGAPATLALGQVAEFKAAGPFTVTSQDADHPFYMSAHMTGCFAVSADTMNDCRGDPEYVNIVPPEQYLASYTFFTDPTYPETNLVLVREKKNGVFADVSVDCAGTVTGWMPIDAADTIEYTRLDLVTGNFQAVNGCNNGLHVATSALPFGLVVWGWGSKASDPFFSRAVSYAYPAGASVKPINQVIIQ